MLFRDVLAAFCIIQLITATFYFSLKFVLGLGLIIILKGIITIWVLSTTALALQLRFSREGRYRWRMYRVMIKSHAWYHGYPEDILQELLMIPGTIIVTLFNNITDKKLGYDQWGIKKKK